MWMTLSGDARIVFLIIIVGAPPASPVCDINDFMG